MKRTFTLLISISLLGVGFSELAGGEDRFEPTVSSAEAEILNNASGIAATNTTAACRYLSERIDPESSAALDFALGNFHYRNDQLDSAVAAYQAAIEKMPLFRTAIANLGRIYLMQDRPARTVDLYRELVENGIADADTYLLLGQAHLTREHYVSGENAFRQALLLRPDGRDALLGLAKTLLQQQRYRESRALLAELLTEEPANSELWSLRANLALAVDDADEALVSIETARRLGGATPEMLAVLGDIYLNRQQPAEAIDAYEDSFARKSPSFKRVVRSIEGLIASGADQRAGRMLGRAEKLLDEAEERGGRAKLLKLKAAIAEARGDRAEARETYRSLLAIDPLNGEALLALAKIEWRAGRIEEALIDCERAARIEGFEAPALVLQAQIEVERENYARAADLLVRAQAFRPQPHIARYLQQVRRLAE